MSNVGEPGSKPSRIKARTSWTARPSIHHKLIMKTPNSDEEEKTRGRFSSTDSIFQMCSDGIGGLFGIYLAKVISCCSRRFFLKPLMNVTSDLVRPMPMKKLTLGFSRICLTAIHNGKIDEAYLLRTYPHYYPEGTPNWITLYNEGADPLRIWQVTRATSAAPFYFQVLEAEIRNQVVGFKDGGIRENNPSGAAYGEFISMYGAEAEPGLLLSIGTGRPEENAGDGFASAWPGPLAGNRIMRKASEKFAVLRNVLIKYTEGEKQHEATRYMAKGENRWYKRLNVASGMEGMKLDDWKRGKWFDPEKQEERIVPGGASLTRMENAVKIMMERDYDAKYDSYAPPSTMVRQAAEKLVRMRRLREKLGKEGDKKWDSFMGKTLTDFGRPVEHESEQAFPDPSLPQLPKMRTNERLDMPNYLNPQLPRASSRVPKPTP